MRHRRRGVLRGAAGPGHPGSAGDGPAAPGPRRPARPGHRIRPGRAGHGGAGTGGDSLGGGRQRARPGPVRGQRGPRRAGQRALRDPGRPGAARAVRGDLVQSADPGRQAGAARVAGPLAGPPGPRGAGPPRGPAEPGRGLAAALAAGAGVAGRPDRVPERLPGAGGELGVSETAGPGQPGEAAPAGGPPRQLRPTDVKRLNRSWRRATGARVALLLDSVTQPFIVGMIVRSAAAFGAEHIWLCGNSATLDHPSAAQTALGTQRLLSWEREPDPVGAAKAARADGLRVVAIEQAAGAYPLHEAPLHCDVCLHLGNDAPGSSHALLAVADAVAYIPLVGRVGSLNVSAAAAIALAEARRREWSPGH